MRVDEVDLADSAADLGRRMLVGTWFEPVGSGTHLFAIVIVCVVLFSFSVVNLEGISRRCLSTVRDLARLPGHPNFWSGRWVLVDLDEHICKHPHVTPHFSRSNILLHTTSVFLQCRILSYPSVQEIPDGIASLVVWGFWKGHLGSRHNSAGESIATAQDQRRCTWTFCNQRALHKHSLGCIHVGPPFTLTSVLCLIPWSRPLS